MVLWKVNRRETKDKKTVNLGFSVLDLTKIQMHDKKCIIKNNKNKKSMLILIWIALKYIFFICRFLCRYSKGFRRF